MKIFNQIKKRLRLIFLALSFPLTAAVAALSIVFLPVHPVSVLSSVLTGVHFFIMAFMFFDFLKEVEES